MTQDFTLRQLAAITGRHVETLRRLARAGKLPGAYRLGDRWLVNREVFLAHRNGRAQEASA